MHKKLAELQIIINFETNKFGFNKTVLSSADMILLSIKVKYFLLQCHLLSQLYFPTPSVNAALVVTLSPTEILSPT